MTRRAETFEGLIALGLLGLTACAESPLGRKQLLLIPQGTVDSSGVQAFDQMKQQQPVDSNPADTNFVNCVAVPVSQIASAQAGIDKWEIVVFQSKDINAFALPGGKIGVFSGILPVTKTAGQLAAVLAHETGHVIAHHGQERMSQSLMESGGLAIADAFAQGVLKDPTQKAAIVGALGLGAQYGVVLPHSRTQENEADLIGLKNMAMAGFDPHEAVALWGNMTAMAGSGPPQWLSDHPSNQNRIDALNANMPEAVQLYNAAITQGKHPNCPHP
jgi:predicted Zn-dependent protease